MAMKKEHDIEERITRNPEVMLGKPVIRGTRVPVYLVVDFVEAGQSPEEIVADYPDLTVEDVEAAVAYAYRERQRIKGSASASCQIMR